MARVNIAVENHGEGANFKKLPENVRAIVVGAGYERVVREASKTRDGKTIDAQTYTANMLRCTLPDSEDPSEVFQVELKCGKHLLPSADGTYLDDRECKTDKERQLHRQSGQAVFLTSLLAAGKEDGTYGLEQEAIVSNSVKALEGMVFHVAYVTKDGGAGIGQYKALIASRIYSFGQNNPDLDTVVDAINKHIAAKGASLPLDIMKGLVGLTASQRALAQNCLNDKTWLGQLYTVDALGKISKSA